MLKNWGRVLSVAGAMLFANVSLAQHSCDTDFNGDGVTDPADFEIFKAALGSSEGDDHFVASADLNQDGSVTSVDYAIMMRCN